MSSTAPYVPPVPIDLPAPSGGARARRLATTLQVFGRRLGPVLARRSVRTPEAVAQGLRLAFEDLGSTYVKFGQLIGSSPGAFGEAVSAEFRTCLDRGPAVPFDQVRAAVEADLGAPVDEVFESFDEAPLAAASIAVVHRARLAGGPDVAVKVLRPGIAARVATDLDVMQPLFRWLAMQGLPVAGPLFRFLHGFRRQVAEELDLRNEARTMARFRELLGGEGLDSVVVPEPIRAEPSVLVMQLLDGVPVDDPAQIAELGVDPKPLIQDLLRSWFLTGLRDGMFHGDIHAGNLMLLRDGRIGMVDWGIVGLLDERTHRIFRRFVEGILGDATAFADVRRFVAELMPSDDGQPLRPGRALDDDDEEFARIQDMLTKPFGEVSLTGAMRGPGAPRDGERHDLRQRIARVRRIRRWRRKALGAGLIDSDAFHADFLLFKQLLYFERYGKMYLADVALLGDREWLQHALDAAGEPVWTRR